MKIITIVFSVFLMNGVALGEVFIYPAKGQSPEQQSRDRYECHTWAVQQTGFDPSSSQAVQRPAAQAAPARRGGQIVRGSGRGAVLGAVGGAIAGDAGKGAAAGAAMGGLFGAMKRRDQARIQQQQQGQAQAQQQSAVSQQRAAYDRAMGACLEGRGYTVK